MPGLTDLAGLAGAGAAIAAALLKLPGIARLRRAHPTPLLLAALVVALVPLGALPAAGYLRGIVGENCTVPALSLGPVTCGSGEVAETEARERRFGPELHCGRIRGLGGARIPCSLECRRRAHVTHLIRTRRHRARLEQDESPVPAPVPRRFEQ